MMKIIGILGMRKITKLTFVSTLGCLILMCSYGLNKKIKWIGDSGLFVNSPSEVAEKYPMEIAPGPKMALIAWPLVLGSNLLSIWWISKMADKNMRVFDKEFYLDWIMHMVLTSMWVFHFDHEQHTINLPLVGLVCSLSYRNLLRICRRLEIKNTDLTNHGYTKISDYKLWVVKNLVVPACVGHSVWSTIAMASTITYAIAYVPSSGRTEAISTGILNPASCSTVGLWYIVMFQMSYTALDLSAYRRYTRHIRMMHPFICVAVVGVCLSNYNPDQGFTENNTLLLLICAFSAVAFVARKWCNNMFDNGFEETSKKTI